jgi:Na+/H+ antiporter NhaC
LLTGGLWVIVWLIVADRNAAKRRKIEKELNKLDGIEESSLVKITPWVLLIVVIIGFYYLLKTYSI